MNAQDELYAIRRALLGAVDALDFDHEPTTLELVEAVIGDKHAAEGAAGLYRKQWKRQNYDMISAHGKLDRLGFAVERIAAALEARQSTVVEYETRWVFSEDVKAAKQEGWEIAGVRTLEDVGPDAYLWYKMRRIEATDTPRQQPAPALEAAQPRNERADPVPEFNVGDPAYLPAHLVRQRGLGTADYHGTIDSRILHKNAWWEYALEGPRGVFLVNEIDLRRPRQQPAPAQDAAGEHIPDQHDNFQVSDIAHLMQDDRWYTSLTQAEEVAIQGTVNNDVAYGIYDKNGDAVSIAYQGELFTK